jgi:hypothetical protein
MTAKSDRVKELLSDPFFQEALANLRNEYRRIMEDHRTSDEDVLEIRRMLHLSTRLEQHLSQIVTDGEFEDFKAQEKERPSFLGDLVWPKNRH